MSMFLDGFVAGPTAGFENALGDGSASRYCPSREAAAGRLVRKQHSTRLAILARWDAVGVEKSALPV
jgi:hypothetical protein